MTDTPRRIIVGLLPSGGAVTYVAEGEVDPVARMIAQAGAELDRQLAAEVRAAAAKAADIERARGMRGARNMRRLKRAMRAVFGRGRGP